MNVSCHQGVALSWANRRPFGARTSRHTELHGQEKPFGRSLDNLRAEGPGLLPAKGNALVIRWPPPHSPFLLPNHLSAQRANRSYAPVTLRRLAKNFARTQPTDLLGSTEDQNLASQVGRR